LSVERIIGHMNRAFPLTTTIVCLVLASGCDRVIVDTAEFELSVVVTVDRTDQTISGTYRCYLDADILDMRGPRWQRISNSTVGGTTRDELVMYGHTSKGMQLQIHSVRNKSRLGEVSICDPSGDEVESDVFYKEPGSINYKSASSEDQRFSDAHEVAIKSSKRALISTGHALHGLWQKSPQKGAQIFAQTHKYYSISIRILQPGEIQTRGLRAYIDSSHRNWLSEGGTHPLDALAKSELSPVFRYRDSLWPYRPSQISNALTVVGNDLVWRSGNVREWSPVGQDSNINADPGRNKQADLNYRTAWILYKGDRIEIPIAAYAWRAAYDSGSDQIVIFYVQFADLYDH
jgi:hypothetical protein